MLDSFLLPSLVYESFKRQQLQVKISYTVRYQEKGSTALEIIHRWRNNLAVILPDCFTEHEWSMARLKEQRKSLFQKQ